MTGYIEKENTSNNINMKNFETIIKDESKKNINTNYSNSNINNFFVNKQNGNQKYIFGNFKINNGSNINLKEIEINKNIDIITNGINPNNDKDKIFVPPCTNISNSTDKIFNPNFVFQTKLSEVIKSNNISGGNNNINYNISNKNSINSNQNGINKLNLNKNQNSMINKNPYLNIKESFMNKKN